MPDADLVERIRAVIVACPFHGEGYRKVGTVALRRRPHLEAPCAAAAAGARPAGAVADRRATRSPQPRRHDHHRRVDAMWGTHLTTVVTSEGQAAVFVASTIAAERCGARGVDIAESK
jgi:putative transposase